MFINEKFDALQAKLRELLQKVEEVHGVNSLISNQVGNSVRDFQTQPTIWDAYQGRHLSQGWSLPSEFQHSFNDWVSAYCRLAEQNPDDAAGLKEAVDEVEQKLSALRDPLYRAKESRVQ